MIRPLRKTMGPLSEKKIKDDRNKQYQIGAAFPDFPKEIACHKYANDHENVGDSDMHGLIVHHILKWILFQTSLWAV